MDASIVQYDMEMVQTNSIQSLQKQGSIMSLPWRKHQKSVRDQTQLLYQVCMPPTSGRSTKSISKIISEKSFIAGLCQICPDISLGIRLIWKTPVTNHGKFHQLPKPSSSSHKSFLYQSTFGPYTPTKAQLKQSCHIFKQTSHHIVSNTLLNKLNCPWVPHNKNTPRCSIRSKYIYKYSYKENGILWWSKSAL